MKKFRNRKINRNPLKLLRIFCEGDKGEVAYLNSIFYNNQNLKKFYAPKIIKPTHNDPKGIVDDLVSEIEIQTNQNKVVRNDIIAWVVFDRDTHSNIPEAYNKASDNNINIAFTNICFEYWILLHIQYCRKSFHNCEEVIKHIKKVDSEFEKNIDYYAKYADKIPHAIKNGKKLEEAIKNDSFDKKPIDINPYTSLHKLVEFLINE